MSTANRIKVIDSHTAGEPTRVVISGFPDLGNAPLAGRAEIFRREYDELRAAIVREPRGHDAIVGALLCPPIDPASVAAVIFFNNVGYLGMCGHGTIGVIRTLEYMGRIGPGTHLIETTAGTVAADLDENGNVTLTNVASFRFAKDVEVEVDDIGTVTGDIAYGGNWFFLIGEHPLQLDLSNIGELIDFTSRVRMALQDHRITGADDAEIDHIELFSPSPTADSRNFVLCPGIEYDRSPCGTGTSAKLACLYADGKLEEGQVWRQESVCGTVFEGWIRTDGDKLIPSIRGTAYVTAEVELVFDELDPFRFGICK